MPGHDRRTAAEKFEFRRRAQRVFVDKPTGDVILRLHETDIVRVTPKGDVILSTGGWATDKTLASMNDALELFGMWVDYSSNITSGFWRVTDSDSTVHTYNNNKVNFMITIPSKGGDDKQRAEWLAEAYEIPYTPPAAAASAATGPRRAAASAGAASGPRMAAAPPAAAPPAAPSWGNGVAAAATTARPPGIGGSWANIAKSSNPLLQASKGPPAASSAAAQSARVTGPGATAAGRVQGPSAAAAAAGGGAPHRTTGPRGVSNGPGSSGSTAAAAAFPAPAVGSPAAAVAAAVAAAGRPSPVQGAAKVTSAPPKPGSMLPPHSPVYAQLAQQMAGLDIEEDAHLCVVCMEEPRSIVLVPCGHMALCKECCEHIMQEKKECPMCCQLVEYHVEVDA